ncbi:MAG: histidine kinase [Ancrocorticia sp.]
MVLGSTIAIAGGLTLRHFLQQETLLRQKRAAAEQERAAAEEKQAVAEQERATAEEKRSAAEEALELAVLAQKEIRQDLAATLHDTLAADLVRIALSSRSLAETIDDPRVSEIAEELEDASRATLRDLRAVIATTKAQRVEEAEPTIASVVQTCGVMLSRRNIKFSADLPENLDAGCSAGLKKNIALVIQESSMNILKYGKDGSEASLSIEIAEEAVDIMITNECASEPIGHQDEITGGFGLTSLSARIADAGGFLDASHRGNRWVLVAHLLDRVKERV